MPSHFDPTPELLTALYARLNGFFSVLTPAIPVGDDVAPDETYPRITFGDMSIVPEDTKDKTGMEYNLEIMAWDRYGGFGTTALIMQDVYRLLHRFALVVANAETVLVEFESADNLRDPDNRTRRTSHRYRIVLSEQ